MQNKRQDTEERNRRSEELRAAREWLDDARAWVELARHVNVKAPPPLNVECACTAFAIQLIFNSLLMAEDKRPRETDGIEKSHRRFKQETQYRIEGWVAEVGFNDCRKVLRTLDAYMPPKHDTFENELQSDKLIRANDIADLYEMIPNLLNLAEQSLSEALNAAQRDAPNHDDDLDAVLAKIQELVNASKDDEYIYRGEREHYDKICSSLYRHYEREIDAENFRIETAQTEILKEVKSYTQEGDDFAVLAQLQHYGGNTNLIDFTTDYLISLFFACDGSHDDDGRVLLVKHTEENKSKHSIVPPQYPQNRVIAQKSVFVQPSAGFIVPDKEVNIPKHLKTPILDYLSKYHHIRTETVYNDLHGFIKSQELHESAYAEFYKGFTCQRRGQSKMAIRYYSNAIKLNQNMVHAYVNRGNVYQLNDDLTLAIRDFDAAIKINPNIAEAYYNRGMAHYHSCEYDLAIQNYNKAISIKPDFSQAYNDLGNALFLKRDVNGAIEKFSKAIAVKPEFADAFFNRATVYYVKEDYDCALQDYNAAIKLQPDMHKAYCYRGFVYLRRKLWDAAMYDLTTATNNGISITSAFETLHKSVPNFQKQIGFELRDDVVTILQST